MVDSFVKKCPQCGKVNGARRDKCEDCGYSLLSVKRVMASSLTKEQPTPARGPQPPAVDKESLSPQEPPELTPENGYKAPAREIPPQPQPSTAMKKICPICDTVTPANITSCPGCQGDLSSTRAIPEDKVPQELERIKKSCLPPPQDVPAQEQPSPAPQQKERVRLCDNPDCNHINPAHIRFCEKCGAPALRMLTRQEAETELKKRKSNPTDPYKDTASKPVPPRPAPQAEVPAARIARLVSLDGLFSYQVAVGTVTLGRLGEMKEYLKEKLGVSRFHAELSFLDGRLRIEDIGSQNGTFVNGIELKANTPQRLKDGDILGLGAGSQRTKEDRANAAFFKVELR